MQGIVRFARPAAAALARRAPGSALQHAAPSMARGLPARAFSTAAASKVLKTLEAEISHEKDQYEQPKEVKDFLAKTDFKLKDEDGDVNMTLEKEVGGKLVQIEWQLTSPFDPAGEMEGVEEEMMPEGTDFCVTIQNKSSGDGISFYCSTNSGEEHRYMIGNVKSFANAEEKDSVSSYNGPEFEDMDERLQGALDEYLAEMGMNSEVCDFMDAMATDKEQREYIRWLQTASKVMS